MGTHVEMRQDAQGDQRDDALTIGSDLVDGVAAVVAGHGVDPVGAMGLEVGEGHGTAVRGRIGDHALGQVAPIESLAVRLCDQLEGAGVLGQAEQLTGCRRPPARQEGVGEAGLG